MHTLNADDLVRGYVAGESINQLAKEFSVSRSVVASRLQKAGVQLRGQSEAERLKWSKMGETERAAQVAAAHAASRGRTDPAERRARRALAFQQTRSRAVPNEAKLIGGLAGIGL